MRAGKLSRAIQVSLLLLACGPGGSLLPGAETRDAGPLDVASRILAGPGVRGGLIAHVHCGDGRLTAALGAKSGGIVQGFATDAALVAEARKHIRAHGAYGRVSASRFDGERLPYAGNMVNLLVAERLGKVTMAEVMRVLAPRGIALVKSGGKWTSTSKPWPDEIDEWTHWLHGADGNAVARDTLSGPPRQLQWIAKPYWSRHHHTAPSVSGFVSAAGRVFSVVDEAPSGMDGSAPDQWVLVARDAFNGLPLWRKPMPEWGWRTWSDDWTCRFTIPTHIARRLVAVGDRVYATLGFNAPLTELDAATGEVLRTFAGSELTDEILVLDGKLIVSLNKEIQRPDTGIDVKRGDPVTPPVRKQVALIDLKSGKLLWKQGDYVGLRSKTGSMERISHLSLCAGDGRVFFVDGDRVIGLSLSDGREIWRSPRPEVPEHLMRYNIRLSDMCALVYQDGVVYLAQLNPDKRVGWREVRGRLHAFSAATGEERWDRQCASWGWGHPADVFVIDGLVWVHDFENPAVLGLDPATGEVKRQISNLEAFDNGHHHRCYRNKATTRFLMTSYRGLEFIDWTGSGTDLNHWVRGTCRLGAFPCNGMIYSTPHPCSCYKSSLLTGFLALAPQGLPTAAGPPSHPLEHGPAYPYAAQADTRKPSANAARNWPMYRHDGRRSGVSTEKMPPGLHQGWEFDLGGKASSCVVADGTVLAANDRHQVVALDAGNGTQLWVFTAGGRIDTPPTIDRGLAYFGCTDGWLYCLRVSDGQLAWRFRGAPQDRWVGALDRIESAWPIHGSPLVKDGAVYFTAGRSSFLDGGIGAFALDAGTGRIVSQRTIASDHAMKVDAGTNRLGDTGLLPDLLVAHGGSIHMRQRQIFPEGQTGPTAAVLRTTAGMLDDDWFSRTRWYLGDIPVAEYFVYDADAVYAVRAREGMSGYSGFVTPGKSGYELCAAKITDVLGADPRKIASLGAREGTIKFPKRWSIRVPLRVTAMALAGDILFAAGSRDTLDPAEPWAAYEGRRGGQLLAVSADSGEVLAQYALSSPPVTDGLVVADGRLFVSTLDGKVICHEDH